MLDIKLIKENPEYYKKRLADRQKNYDADIDNLMTLDAERRALIADVEAKKANQNAINKQIPQMKKEGKDVTPIFAEMKEIAATIKKDDERVSEIDAQRCFINGFSNLSNTLSA